ncbi:TerB N-terminal domain-containing protein [uncultured Tateyamaria sp.]|uniref:tellurite resistance TerB family protein n=1 Tax=uncultured Tateyamaria sp. TaxID=455651 RepID=UPI0026123C7A|nr:TerB N-terminal domain-containing protein [uncultured Tateyamaria sp.]
MASIFKFFRVIFFYALYFLICTVVLTVSLQSWSDGAQMLFAFGLPVVLVWWQEKRRSRKVRAKELGSESVKASGVQPEPAARISAYAKRIEKEREKTREANTIQSSSIASPEPPKQDYAEIVRAGESAAPALSTIAKRYENARSTSQKKQSNSRKSGWIPATETATVAGRDIGGMVYVGTPPLLNHHGYRDKCRAYIDPSLSVARTGDDRAGEGMSYWPGYSDISTRSRATYLEWLASGRSDPSYDPGYMFLYFYGLERRFFVDQSNAEAKEIIAEVRRLLSLYPENHSVRRYLGEFLDIATLAETEFEALEPTFERQGWELPFSLKYAIGARLDKGENLGADWVLSWLMCHPESHLRTPATRCRDEFLALFKIRFDDRFPNGLKVNKPRKHLKATYRSASSEFEGTLNPTADGKPVPDISGLRKPVEIAQEVADEVIDDLDKLSRYLGRNPEGKGSIEAHALLPIDLWSLFPSAEMEALKEWARGIMQSGGLVPLADVIEKLEGPRSTKIGKRQLTGAADALARLGFGLAPDPRFALRSPKPEEPVVLFDLCEQIEKLEDVSASYQTALMELALASFVAHADGRIAQAERKALEIQVASVEGLNEQERRRLWANMEWFLAVPPDMTLLRRKLKDVGVEDQTAMRVALVGAAHADGVIQSEEVASIEKVYKALGLDPSLAYSDLHAGEIADTPRTVRSAQPGRSGEAIPEPDKANGPVLDASRIAAIRSDTERVSSVLGQIFEAEEDAEESNGPSVSTLFKGLDAKHGALLLDLVGQEHWTEDAFEQLCGQHGLMPSGALEAVNEWAFETHDEALLDEYDGYDVSPQIADAVKQIIRRGGASCLN